MFVSSSVFAALERKDSVAPSLAMSSQRSESVGVVYDVMTGTRDKYHYDIRRAKKLSDKICARNLLDAALQGAALLVHLCLYSCPVYQLFPFLVEETKRV